MANDDVVVINSNVVAANPKNVDVSDITQNGGSVAVRQRVVNADPVRPDALAAVRNRNIAGNEYANTVRLLSSDDLEEIKQILSEIRASMPGYTENQASFDVDSRLMVSHYYPETRYRDVSGKIASGGTAQVLFQATTVKGFEIQNLSSDPIGISFINSSPVIGNPGTITLNGGSATIAGGSYRMDPDMGFFRRLTIYVIGATTGDAYTCHYW